MMDPFVRFSDWYDEAQKDPPFSPDIVALASATKDGRPSVRMVFYRGIREGGLSFFTNYESRKGHEFIENPRAAMAFYWPHRARQVRVEGSVERLSAEESDSYFRSRPFQSQITALVSRQSRAVPDQNGFHIQLANLEQSFCGKQILRPKYWGGFKIVPVLFEFWIRGAHRRHDRVVYKKDGEAWDATRLYP
jgi:pyridoxamine 5'-phosphate oxidase